MEPSASDELCAMSASALAAAIRSRRISPVDAVDAVLARIGRENPRLNAFVTLYPEEARAAAREAERKVMAGEQLGKLHGVPVSIKDTYWVQNVRHTGGSALLRDFVATEDAPPVARLRAAGGIDVGKTNTPEFGWRGTTANVLFGETRNPWDLSLTPGGSSGGAAAAVAAGLAPLALGGDGAGSIRIPASFCGIVGFKPTFGRVPVYPPVATNELVIHTGPMTRTVRDAALMLSAMAGYDPRDPFSLPLDPADFCKGLDDGIAGLRVAWSRDLGHMRVEDETAEIAAAAARGFEPLGVNVEEATLGLDDLAPILGVLWGGHQAGLHAGRPAEEKARMDPALVAYAEAHRHLGVSDYVKAVAARQAVVGQLHRFFERYDLLLTPATAVPAFPLGHVNPDGYAHLNWSLAYPFNWSGQPAISVPAGWTKDGRPVGLQIVGRRLEDALVLRAAAAFEQARPWADRWPPTRTVF